MSDSSKNYTKEYSYLDSSKSVISEVVITGNDITRDEIILREMSLLRGKIFSSENCKDDRNRIYNLGLFHNVEITPITQPGNKIKLVVAVQEKWYIFPFPQVSFTDGDIRKISVGANVRWQNFRGRDENVSLSFGVGYNPFIKASYTIPWIGENLHMFTSFSGSYSNEQNRSFLALGKATGEPIQYSRDTNFSYSNYTAKLTVGKFFTKMLSAYAEGGYTFMRVSQYADNRTLSPNGVDKYLLMGLGLNFDNRDSHEYSTKGFLIHVNYEHYGLLSHFVNFGRFSLEQRDYIPVNITNKYAVTLASKFYTSIAVGSQIPYYNHKYLGYGSESVRGWSRYGYEGDNDLTLYNEIRIPIIQPDFIKGEDIPLINKIKYTRKLSYKYGLYFTVFYDIGGIWNEDDKIKSIQFQNGTGIGLNAILPFGLIGKVEWAFRLGKPTVGQAIFGLGAKF